MFIDNDSKCHVSNPNGTYIEVPMPPEFGGKCAAYIEGFRVKPEGYSFVREDGKVFGPDGYTISPWRDLALLDEFQAQYEAQQQTINEYEAALSAIETALGVTS